VQLEKQTEAAVVKFKEASFFAENFKDQLMQAQQSPFLNIIKRAETAQTLIKGLQVVLMQFLILKS